MNEAQTAKDNAELNAARAGAASGQRLLALFQALNLVNDPGRRDIIERAIMDALGLEDASV